MAKINTKVMGGFVELAPREQAVFNRAKSAVAAAYESAGYMNSDTPVIERTEVLLAKSAGETEKQIYFVKKEGHDDDMALRFDLTVPFARYVADHYGEVRFPFKRYQIDKVYRGERAQKGRYREFYQADIDVVAENNLPVEYDADVIATLADALKKLDGIVNIGAFTVHISNRKIWNDAGLEDAPAALALLDKKMKMSAADFEAELSKLPDSKKIRKILERNGADCLDLQTVYNLLNDNGIKCEIDLSIVRGLDYYTGTVFETFIDGKQNLGSVASGGRYKNLVGQFINKNIIGVGGSIGLSRLCVPLIEEGAFKPASAETVVIIPKTPAQNEQAFKLARAENATAIFADKEVKKPYEIAVKRGATSAIVIDEDNQITRKTLS